MEKKRRTLAIAVILGAAGVLFIIALWYLAAYLLLQSGNSILPYPHKVASALGEILFMEGASKTYIAIGWSVLRVLIGFTVSFILGAILGTLAGLFPKFGNFMAPGTAIMRCLPTAAVLSVLIAIFYSYRGLPDYIPSILGLLVAFPVIYEAFRQGILENDHDVMDSLDIDAGRLSLVGVVWVRWPMSESYIQLASVQSLGLCIKVTVMSEIMVQGGMTSGLGVLISDYINYLEMDKVIAVSILAVALIMVFDLLTTGFKRDQKAKIKALKTVSTNDKHNLN